MPAQSGLLHAWSHIHKTMKEHLHRFLESDSKTSPDLQNLHLPSFFGQMAERGAYIETALKIRFSSKYDHRLPLVIQGNAALLRLTVSTMLDYAMDRHHGVGYTVFAVNLIEEDGRDYVSFDVWHTGVYKGRDDGVRTWFSHNQMERISALMGGSFSIKEQHGTEARYAVKIPLIPGDSSIAASVSLAPSTARLVLSKNGATALVVDDSSISRALGVYLLSRHNIAADVAENGQAALEKLVDKRYDLIFMDYSMPGLNGIQTAASAREKDLLQASLIIGLDPSAGYARNMKAVFFKAGMQGYLAKPVDPLELNLLLLDLLPCLHGQTAETSEQTDTSEPSDSRQKSLIRALSGIAGLDAEKGLANAGHSVEIYTGMLRRFTSELTDYIEPLLTLSNDGSWDEVATRLHVLREFFVSIGAEDLAREAASLAAADAEGGGECLARIQRYCDAMMRLRARLLSFKARNGRENAAKRREQRGARIEPMDPVKLKRYVSRLHDACLSHRATEAQATADGLRRMALYGDMEEQIEAICALVDTLEYREARERCARLLQTIAMRGSGKTR